MNPVIIGDATLYCGDCMDILPTLPKVDAVITDPPYGINGGAGGDAKKHKKAHYVCSDWEDTPEYIKLNPVAVVEFCIANGIRAALTPGRRCAFLYPNPADIGGFWIPGAANNGKWGFGLLDPILYYGKDPRAGLGAGTSGTVITDPARIEGHPAAKSIKSMLWLVNKASLRGETVCDPFMGSGTTGVASIELRRKFIGIEREPKYFDIACKRIEAAYAQGKLFEPEPMKQTQEALL